MMYMFSGVLDEDFLVELPPESISEHVISWEAYPQTPYNVSMLWTEAKTQFLDHISSLET